MNEMDELKNSIEIPDELDLAIGSGIERGRKEKNKSLKLRRNRIIKKLGLAVGSIAIITTIVVLQNQN